jgi:hypothetical protein
VCNQSFPNEAGGIYIDFEEPIDISTGRSIEIMLYSYKPAKMIVKLEDSSIPDYEVKKELLIGATSEWETVNFKFRPTDGYHDRLTIVFFPEEMRVVPFYIDNIRLK